MRDADLEHPSVGNPPPEPEREEPQPVEIRAVADPIRRKRRCCDEIGPEYGCERTWADMQVIGAGARGDGGREYRICSCGWAWYLDEGE